MHACRKDTKGQTVKMRSDDNEFTLTYKEITGYGFRIDKKGNRVWGAITQPKATRAIDELMAKGFVDVVEYGGAYDKHKQIYALVDDWLKWKVGDSPFRLRKKDRRRGFQAKGLGVAKQKTAHTNVNTHTHTSVAHPPQGTHT